MLMPLKLNLNWPTFLLSSDDTGDGAGVLTAIPHALFAKEL